VVALEIVSLRDSGDGSWLALVLEGERLAQFRFVTSGPVPTDEQMHDLIQAHAPTIAALRAGEQAQAFGDRIRRVVDVSPPLAAAA
jgi:hypothetical protein